MKKQPNSIRFTKLDRISHNDDGEYFAAAEKGRCVDGYIDKVEMYRRDMKRTSRINLYRNAWLKFNQGYVLKGFLYRSGSEGELTNISINHFRNLVTHSVNLVTQQKLAYEPQATTSDSEAQDQVKIARGQLAIYSTDSDIDLDGVLREALTMSYVFGESYVSVLWDKTRGRNIATDDDGLTVYEGDNEFNVWSPFDVIVDVTLPSRDLVNWMVLCRWENKFDVAARYPAFADDIVSRSASHLLMDTQLTYSLERDSDAIPVYYAFHRKTPAIPGGRLTIYIDSNIILADGPNNYRHGKIPIFRVATANLWGSVFGYSRGFDLLPCQEIGDRLNSSVITNMLTFSTQNVLLPKGADITWEDIYGGLNLIEWDASQGNGAIPQALQLCKSPAETFAYMKDNVTTMGTLAGVNDAIRGNPDLVIKGGASGASLAMMTSNAIEFNSDLQKTYVTMAERVGTQAIRNLQDFGFQASTNMKRLGMVSTVGGKMARREFAKSEIDKIDKIVVRLGNPMMQTTSGKLQVADTLIQHGDITPAQYFEVLDTGNLEQAFKSEEATVHTITEENEMLLRGEIPVVEPYDNHPVHMKEHNALMSSWNVRSNPKLTTNILKHIGEHWVTWTKESSQNPNLLVALGIQPLQPAQAPAQPPVAATPQHNGSGGPAPIAKPSLPTPNNAGIQQSVPLPQSPLRR